VSSKTCTCHFQKIHRSNTMCNKYTINKMWWTKEMKQQTDVDGIFEHQTQCNLEQKVKWQNDDDGTWTTNTR
jgi:hypothetical protein